AGPGGPVDDLTLLQGHWPNRTGQIVMARGDGIFAGSTVTVGSRRLAVVGVADSVTGTADGWVLPREITALGGRRAAGQAQLLYRFASAGRAAAITADIAAVRAALPRGALLDTVSYLDVRQAEQGNVAPWVPFVIAFGVMGLVISVLIVVNVVGGAVIAGTTRIGVLKAIGFTPGQVAASYVLLVAMPALAGCAAGAVLGNLLAIPMLRANAAVYGVGTLGVPLWVDGAVPLGAFALIVAAAVAPALRAGRMSPVQAIAAGRAPQPGHGYLPHRVLARVRSAPRPVMLGLAAPFARPSRTMLTAAAIVFGAASVTFAAGLAASLNRVIADKPGSAMPVEVSSSRALLMPAKQRRVVVATLAREPATRRYLPVSSGQVSLPGLAATVSVTTYGGHPRWAGTQLISGRWYSGPAAEADVNTMFLTETGTSVGSRYPLSLGGRRITVRIVGQVFEPGHGLNLYLSPATLAVLDPAAGPGQFYVAVRPGTSVPAYVNALSAALGRSYQVTAQGGAGKQYLAVISLIGMLTILIMTVAGLGVLNTVALQIRERARDIGVFKALGMTPRQTLVMIVCSVALVGLAAGLVAVPAGVYLHHGVVPVMAHAANSGYPPSLISVYGPAELVLLGLAGLVIAVGGALGPAGWAARSRTAFALRAE
ncbi:MAG TPA: ABC transporter permease, partial [Streptosporangiaceae bacterium]|nr:ABC transporter permease [Streptosporangiaceae bacterium]